MLPVGQISSRAIWQGNPPSEDGPDGSGCSDAAQESIDFISQMGAFARQRLGGGQDLCRGRAGLARSALHINNVRRHLLGALSRLLHVARDFLCRGTLLFYS